MRTAKFLRASIFCAIAGTAIILAVAISSYAQDVKLDSKDVATITKPDSIPLNEADGLRMQNKMLEIENSEQRTQLLRSEALQMLSLYYQKYGVSQADYNFNLNPPMQFTAKKPQPAQQ